MYVTKIGEAQKWLETYLTARGAMKSRDVKDAGIKAGHQERLIQKASNRLNVIVTAHGFPRNTYWELVA